MAEIFLQVSIALLVVLVISSIMRLLKQPLIIGYILSGILIGPFLFNIMPQGDIISIFSEFGIAFLLFIVGLHLSPKVIKEVGKISVITGIGQVIFTSIIGYFIAIWLGFPPLYSIYIAIALTFSSTIIITKLLSDKNALDKLYGKISIGFLLIQDIIAIGILIFISSFAGKENIISSLASIAFKGTIILALFIPLSYFVLPKLSSFFARSQEFLFIFAITWGLGLASAFFYSGLSIEVGALIAGIMLSMSPYSYEISSKLRPLRDFFIIYFFISLGTQMVFGGLSQFIIPAIIFSLFILIGNPLIVMVLMGLFGYRKNTSFMSGLTVAQISEFSLILIALGVKVGHLSKDILSFVTVIGLITIAGSTYLIMYSEKIYPRIYRYLSVFERKIKKEAKVDEGKYDIILFGYNRIGYDFLETFRKLKKRFLVIDYNPDIISHLSSVSIPCRYGDADDIEFLQELHFSNVKMVISTIPDFETNLLLINTIRKKSKRTIVIVVAHQISEAYKLYEKGATYVLMPHFLGGHHASLMVGKHGLNIKKFLQERKKHIKHLKERKGIGHEHPKIEKHNL